MQRLIPEVEVTNTDTVILGSPTTFTEWRNKAILAIITLSVSFGFGEGVTRWLDIFDPPAFQANPSYGYLMRPNQSVSTRGYRFRINNVGFRGKDIATPKSPSVFRAAFLGDSVTYGGGEVPDPDLFVNRFARSLKGEGESKVESLNVSAPGWGIQNMAAYIRERGLYESDCLVWVISWADFRRPKTSLEEHGFWETKPSSRLFYGAAVVLRRAYVGAVRGISEVRAAKARSTSEALDANLEIVQTTLAGLKERGIVSVVVVVPDANRCYGSSEDLQKYKAITDRLAIRFLDLGPIFQQHKAEKLFFDSVHLTSRGHGLAAEAIVSFFYANSLKHDRSTE